MVLLAGCQALESQYNPDHYGPWLSVVNQKLPAYDLPNELDFLNEKLVLKQRSKDTQSGNINDKRATIYSLENKKGHLLIMDEIVGSADQALALLKSQAKFRGDNNPTLLNYESAKYVVGVDQKMNWGYLILSTYDEALNFTRIKIYLFVPSEENYQRMEKIGGDNIVKELLLIGKVK